MADNSFKVTYNGNGSTSGSVPVDSQEYASGDVVTVLDSSTLFKTSYHFMNWNTAADGSGTNYLEGDQFTITQNITLYAVWANAAYSDVQRYTDIASSIRSAFGVTTKFKPKEMSTVLSSAKLTSITVAASGEVTITYNGATTYMGTATSPAEIVPPLKYCVDNISLALSSSATKLLCVNLGTQNILWMNPGESKRLNTKDRGVAGITLCLATKATIPSQSGTLTFTASQQSPTWSNYITGSCTITGDTSATSSGTYTAIFTPNSGYRWEDGSADPKEITWTIAKRVLTIPSTSGTYTFNGANQTVTLLNVDNTYEEKTSASVTTAFSSGTYNIYYNLKYPNDTTWSDGTTLYKVLTWSIQKASFTIPTVTGDYQYDGTVKTCVVSNFNNLVETQIGTASTSQPGVYTLTWSLKYTSDSTWSDGTKTSKQGSWRIWTEAALTFTAVTAGSTVQLTQEGTPTNITLLISTDSTTWTSYTVGDVITLSNVGDCVQFKGTTTTFSTDNSNYYYFVLTGTLNSSGALDSLINYTPLTDYVYYSLFKNCYSLRTPPLLSSVVMQESCYNNMFFSCTNLEEAPALPATALAANCYSNMFLHCRSLTSAPDLPALVLASGCYSDMFNDCTSLTTMPTLLATELAFACYHRMFSNCTSITIPTSLPAETLEEYCYWQMFKGCTSLTVAPELPALTLVNSCYKEMFEDCSSLSLMEVRFSSWESGEVADATTDWVKNVAATGTFYCPSELPETMGDSNIPIGWIKTTLVINNLSYNFNDTASTFRQGMTWRQYVNSIYNTIGAIIGSDSCIYIGSETSANKLTDATSSASQINASDLITTTGLYNIATLGSISIDSTNYSAKSDMTWRHWIASVYNTISATTDTSSLVKRTVSGVDKVLCSSTGVTYVSDLVNLNSSYQFQNLDKPETVSVIKTYDGTLQTNDYTPPTHISMSGNNSGTSAGTYTATYTPDSGYCWSDGSTESVDIVLTINCASVGAKPVAPYAKTYTGSTITNGYTTPANVTMTGKNSGKTVGTYTAYYTPNTNYCWSDGTTVKVGISLIINKAANGLTVDDTKSLSSYYAEQIASRSLTATGYTGTLSSSIVSGGSNFTLTNTTTLNIKASVAVGTYTLTVRFTATGDSNHESVSLDTVVTWKQLDPLSGISYVELIYSNGGYNNLTYSHGEGGTWVEKTLNGIKNHGGVSTSGNVLTMGCNGSSYYANYIYGSTFRAVLTDSRTVGIKKLISVFGYTTKYYLTISGSGAYSFFWINHDSTLITIYNNGSSWVTMSNTSYSFPQFRNDGYSSGKNLTISNLTINGKSYSVKQTLGSW